MSKCCTSWFSLSPGACSSGFPSLQVSGLQSNEAQLQQNARVPVLTLCLTSVPAGFVLIRQVTRHTFGLVQSKLFPVYFYCVLGSNFVSLAVYAVYHPRELLDWHESVQVKYHTLLGMKKLSTFDWGGKKKIKLNHHRAASFPFSSCRCFCSSWR